jgi:hypothetical protein
MSGHFMHTLVLALFLVLCGLAPAQGRAASDDGVIGAIIEVEGTATLAMSGQGPVAASVDMPVRLKDVIETGAGSKVNVLFIDDTEVTLGENGRLAIDQYVYDPAEPGAHTGRFSIMRGTFMFVSGLINKTDRHDLKIDTPYGAIGMRGTTVLGGQDQDSYGIFVQDGAVEVENDAGRVQVGAGQGTSLVHRKMPPQAVKAWAPDKTARFSKAVQLKRAALVRERIAARKQVFAQKRQLRQQQNPQLRQQQKEELRQQQKEELRQRQKEGLRQQPRVQPDKQQVLRQRQERSGTGNTR